MKVQQGGDDRRMVIKRCKLQMEYSYEKTNAIIYYLNN